MFKKSEIEQQLNELNVPGDVPVIVHTSLRAVGEVEGRAEGLLDVLIKHCTKDGGLLIIPTHTWAFLREEGRIALDLKNGGTCIGVLPDIAASRRDAHRSVHPTHSVAVFGENNKAEEFISNEFLFDTPANPKGCYGKLYSQKGKILLLGVGQERNTYIHSVDEMLSLDNRLSKEPKTAVIRFKDGRTEEKLIYPHFAKGIGTSISARFTKFDEAFEKNNAVKYGRLGNAKATLCDAVLIKKTLEKIYRRNGYKELMADDFPIEERYYI